MIQYDISPLPLIEADQHLNASIYEKQGSYFLAYRASKGVGECQLAIHPLDMDPEGKFVTNPAATSTILDIPPVRPNERYVHEDPRVFKFHGEPWVAFTTINVDNDCQSQAIAKLPSIEGDSVVLDPIYIDHGDNLNGASTPQIVRDGPKSLVVRLEFPVLMEKNWPFFEHKGCLNFVYQASPFHEVVSLNDDFTVRKVYRTRNEIRWPFGEIRGGSSPISYDEKSYIMFFHSSFRPPQDSWIVRETYNSCYVMGAYLFDKKSPHRITGVTRRPLMVGDFNDPHIMSSTANHYGLWGNGVVFPCGCVWYDNRYHVSMGWNDYKIKIAVISPYEISSELKCISI